MSTLPKTAPQDCTHRTAHSALQLLRIAPALCGRTGPHVVVALFVFGIGRLPRRHGHFEELNVLIGIYQHCF